MSAAVFCRVLRGRRPARRRRSGLTVSAGGSGTAGAGRGGFGSGCRQCINANQSTGALHLTPEARTLLKQSA